MVQFTLILAMLMACLMPSEQITGGYEWIKSSKYPALNERLNNILLEQQSSKVIGAWRQVINGWRYFVIFLEDGQVDSFKKDMPCRISWVEKPVRKEEVSDVSDVQGPNCGYDVYDASTAEGVKVGSKRKG